MNNKSSSDLLATTNENRLIVLYTKPKTEMKKILFVFAVLCAMTAYGKNNPTQVEENDETVAQTAMAMNGSTSVSERVWRILCCDS